jgi:hypothetical protein
LRAGNDPVDELFTALAAAHSATLHVSGASSVQAADADVTPVQEIDRTILHTICDLLEP